MTFRNLRDFIRALEDDGELVRIDAQVDPELEISEITDRVSKGPLSANKALLFENVKGSDMRVLINAFGSASRMATALNVADLDDLNKNLAKVIDMRLPRGLGATLSRAGDLFDVLRSVGLKPKLVSKAPSQEVVITDAPALSSLPILKCWPLDGGRYITLMQVITRDPVTNVRNVGMYRLQVRDESSLMMHWQRHKGGAEHERVAQEARKPQIPCAIALGGDPASMWCASAPLPPNIDEYLLAGYLRGKPIEFVKCVTQPIEAPAEAEIVIEGYVEPNEHEMEGPFGDHTGYYTPADLFPVFHVTAITHRKNAIYPATIVGIPPMEDYWMGKATERLFLPLLRLFLGEVVDYNMPAEGVFHNLVIVSIKKRFPGHPQKVMFGIWGLGMLMLSKAIIVVDESVNVHDLSEVAWRVLGNIDWKRDVTVVEGAVDQLDHSAIRNSFGGKIGIDATAKGAEDNHPRGWPQQVVMDAAVKELVTRRWKEYGL
ncbi:MAG: menaquinone biosynthesis decarboxylase [Chloroflexi bacterium]|nr:menaquinone biosynthesis decarboxylase [Chloroflexota bacterium]MCL5273571.1 menaquinone biosynthesis decarboxylase [Chloroflexota bacterium]